MLNFSIVNDWEDGFTGNLSITNSGTAAINNWTIEFDGPFEITNLWNGEIVSQNENRYVIRNAAWNSTIQPNETISFGFNGNNPNGLTIEPTNYRLNGTDIQVGDPPIPETINENDQDMASPSSPSTGDHNHGGDHNHSGEHNHDEEPLPDNVNTDPLAEGGRTFYSDGTTQRITNFDPSKDKVDIGTDSIHNQIPIDTPDGLVFQNMFNPNRSLTLVGINLEDLRAENFNPISDAHLQQDL
ncbi:MAG: cellulose-binding domain-containing protein, partial [Cyanobacteria bacterium P01_F01_bin.116]